MKKLRHSLLVLLTATMGFSASPAFSEAMVNKKMPSNTAQMQQKLDLNSATVEQLMQLPGIGKSKAEAIIAYRTEMGRFLEIEQITQVNGIGPKMLSKIADKLTLQE